MLETGEMLKLVVVIWVRRAFALSLSLSFSGPLPLSRTLHPAVSITVSLFHILSRSLSISVSLSPTPAEKRSLWSAFSLAISLSLCRCPRLPVRSTAPPGMSFVFFLCLSISDLRALYEYKCPTSIHMQYIPHYLYIWDGNCRGLLTG